LIDSSDNTIVIVLSLLALISAIGTIRANYSRQLKQIYVFKPLTTVLIISIAVLGLEPPSLSYKLAIVAGLIFSLAGDIFLMLPSDRFVSALISFLIAHLLYIFAFSTVGGFYASIWSLLPFLLFGVSFMILMWPDLGSMKIPALIYALAIVIMAWQAFGNWHLTGQLPAFLAFIGALLFVISDSVLTLNRFKISFQLAQAIILSTYYAAQWLIALSAGAVAWS
jgi:uncharacterized membrane protein YhhN